MKVFFDTNAYVAEALAQGLAARILQTTQARRWRIFTSEYVLDETRRVLTHVTQDRRRGALARIRCARRATLITTRPSKHRVYADPKDSPILAAAVQAGVDYLVTNDKELLALNPYEGVRIFSMTEYWDLLKEISP